MRQITQDSIDAFYGGYDFKRQNMEVIPHKSDTAQGTFMYLHGNKIARLMNGQLDITNAGWQSVTTKERLNGLNGVSIQQKAGVWYLNGEEWGGEWTLIK